MPKYALFIVDGLVQVNVNVPGMAKNVQAGTVNVPVAIDSDNQL